MIDKRNVRNLYPLTPLQEGMLFHALHQPDSRAYFERLEYGLEGAIDIDAWRGAWQDLTDRHDILRTLFAVRNTPRPLQVVLREVPAPVEWHDLSADDEAGARARIEAWKATDLARGFELTRAIPWRVALFGLGGDRHRVVWSFHHILLDGWCLGILQHEFDRCYLARLSGQQAQLPPAPAYATYVRWLQARDLDADRAYWRTLLDGFETPTPVPPRIDQRFREGGAAPSSTRIEHRHALDTADSTRLGALARELGVTPSSVVQALWGLLLAASHGSREAVFAATVSGRPAELAGAEATVGLFINAVAVRVGFEANETLGTLIRRVHEQAIASRAHDMTPLADVQADHPLRDRLIDHILVFENYPQHDTPADPRLPRASEDDVDLHEYTHYGFEFQFLPGTQAVLRFRYDPARHDAATVASLGARLAALLRSPADAVLDATLNTICPNWRGPRRIGLAASFTVEPVEQTLRQWLRRFGQPGVVSLAPYNQCPTALLDPAGALAGADLAVLLYRPEDGLRDLDTLLATDPEAAAQRLQARHQATVAAFDQWRARNDAPPLVVGLLPSSLPMGGAHPGAPSGLRDLVARLDQDWTSRVNQAASPRIAAVDLRDPRPLSGLPGALWPDPAAERLGHVPYTESACEALGAVIARNVLARSRAPFKVLAVDCDNTLWSGVCGEAGPLGVAIEAPHRALQRFLIARQDEGFLIVLASKNIENDVWAVFDRNPDMLLKREHITAAAINWQAKSGNLRTLATQLNLGIDSFIFLDDNPAEIAEVAHHCPEVLALPLPAEPARMDDWLALLWACDVPAVTAEDRERTRMMQAEVSRQALLAGTDSLDAFLASIELRLVLGPMAAHQLPRVAQLTQRTNQFNLSGKRRDEAEVAALAARDDTEVLAVEVEDKFGAYGLTGVVIARHDPSPDDGGTPALVIDTFLLSCRVLGRRVEQGIVTALARLADARSAQRILAPLRPTERNAPIRQFLATPPWREAHVNHFVCDVATALEPVAGITLVDQHVFTPPVATPPRNTTGDTAGASAPRPEADSAAAGEAAQSSAPDSGMGSTSDSAVTTATPLSGATATSAAQASAPTAITTDTPATLPTCAAPGDAVASPNDLTVTERAACAPLPLPIELDAQLGARHTLQFLPWLARAAGWPLRPLPDVGPRLRTADGDNDPTDLRAPTSDSERRVADVFATVLRRDAIDAERSFAELGGHSLHAVRAVSRLEQAFGRSLGLTRFYELGSVSALAAWFDATSPHASSPQSSSSASTSTSPAEDAASPLPEVPRAAQADDYPLSHSQQRIWLLSRLDNAPAAYNQCAAWRLRGALDTAALSRALHSLSVRHEALRTVFPLTDDGPRQRILPELAPTWRVEDAAALSLPALSERIGAEGRRPFDLEQGPLLRATLYRRADDDHVLALALHHIISDGWSFGRLLDDLAAAYRTAVAADPLTAPRGLATQAHEGAGQEIDASAGSDPVPASRTAETPDTAATPAPTLRYRDYACWTRSAAFDAYLEPQRTYWRQRLGGTADRQRGLREIPMIPGDRPRAAVASGRGGALTHRFTLDAQTRNHLDTQLTTRGLSLFQWLASLVMVLIARHGESPHLAHRTHDAAHGDGDGRRAPLPVRIGTPVAGRALPELDDVLGVFVNTVVLDAEVDPDAPLEQLLDAVRATTLGALAHQHYPFERLVEDLAPARDPARNPLFDVLVALQNAPRSSDGLPGIAIEDQPVPLGISAFDLVFEFAEDAAGLALQLTYASDLYDAATARQLAERLDTLLRAALRNPEARVGDLPLLTTSEAERIAAFARGPRHERPGTDIGTAFARVAQANPDAIALVDHRASLDYAGLAARADALAAALLEHGARPGDRVAVLLPRATDWAVALLATLRAGLVYLPLEARHPAGRLHEILADAAPACLLAMPEQLQALGGTVPCPCLDPRTLGEGLASTGDDHHGSARALPTVDPRQDAYLLYTSGSTGTPKGVRVSHAAFLNMITAQIAGFAVGEDDVVLQLASCAFDASLSEFFMGWLAGATVALADEQTVGDGHRLGAFLTRHAVSLATFTPSYLRSLEDTDLASLSRVILAGEAVYGRDVARLAALGVVAYNAYGPTETAVCATLGLAHAGDATAAVPIGRPLDNLVVDIRDPRGHVVPIGVFGELQVFGVGVANGYWQRPELNAERFIDDPRHGRGYRTGDLGRWTRDGRIEYHGRIDEQVKLRGLRVEPGEIGARLRALPGVRQAEVSIEGGIDGDELVAWVSLAPSPTTRPNEMPANPPPDLNALRQALARTLPAYMQPSRWEVLPELPLTASGKLDRRRLATLRGSTTLPPKAVATTALETRLLPIWQAVLGDGIDVDSDLFAAGGNSLTAMRLARRIATALDRPCPAILLFRHTTVRTLSAALDEAANDAPRWTVWNPRSTRLNTHVGAHPGTASARIIALPPAPGLGSVYAGLAARLADCTVEAVDFGDNALENQLESWIETLEASAATTRDALILFGHSAGGRLAIALATRLLARGCPPRAIILADTWRWNANDPALEAMNAELLRRAGEEDRATADALGLAGQADRIVRLGQHYRLAVSSIGATSCSDPHSSAHATASTTEATDGALRALDGVPIHHLLAEHDSSTIPQGVSRDWRDATTGAYVEHAVGGGHFGVLTGPHLEDNTRLIRALIDSILGGNPPRENPATGNPAVPESA